MQLLLVTSTPSIDKDLSLILPGSTQTLIWSSISHSCIINRASDQGVINVLLHAVAMQGDMCNVCVPVGHVPCVCVCVPVGFCLQSPAYILFFIWITVHRTAIMHLVVSTPLTVISVYCRLDVD